MRAYARSNETGSVGYMERLVVTQPEACHRDIYNIVLQARANQKMPGSGLRAEEFLNQLERMSTNERNNRTSKQQASFQPNMETVFHVASAYLDEEPSTYQNVADADRMVRRLCSKYHVVDQDSSTVDMMSVVDTPWPIFHCVLSAYTQMAAVESRAIAAADNLCRFFLSEYRNKRVCERPGSHHLRSVLEALNQNPTRQRAEASIELVRLFERLDRSTVTSENRDLLSDTLAKCRENGPDDLAIGLTRDSLTKSSTNISLAT